MIHFLKRRVNELKKMAGKLMKIDQDLEDYYVFTEQYFKPCIYP